MAEHEVELRPLFPPHLVEERVVELTRQIADELGNDPLIVVGLLTGSFVFVADVVRQLHLHGVPLMVDFIKVSSYGCGTESSGDVQIEGRVKWDVGGKNVLIVDDILDTGHTLAKVRAMVAVAEPAALKTCVLLDKPSRRAIDVRADYVGFEVPNEFVVGYGIDYDEHYRELPGIMTVDFHAAEEAPAG